LDAFDAFCFLVAMSSNTECDAVGKRTHSSKRTHSKNESSNTEGNAVSGVSRNDTRCYR